MKHVHLAPASCLQPCIEGVAKVEFDSIELLSLSEGFMRDEIHFLHVDVYISTLPCPNPAVVLTHFPIPQSVSAAG